MCKEIITTLNRRCKNKIWKDDLCRYHYFILTKEQIVTRKKFLIEELDKCAAILNNEKIK